MMDRRQVPMFDFLGLPAELRTMIYRQSLVTDKALRLCLRLCGPDLRPTNINIALLLVNYQVHHEGLEVFYAYNTVAIPDYWPIQKKSLLSRNNKHLSREERLIVRAFRVKLCPKLLACASTFRLKVDWLVTYGFPMTDPWTNDKCWYKRAHLKELMKMVDSVYKSILKLPPDLNKVIIFEFPYAPDNILFKI